MVDLALFVLHFHIQSEQDIKLALASGYPEELAYKLYQRRAKIQTVFKVIPHPPHPYLAPPRTTTSLLTLISLPQDLDGACASYRQALKATELASKLSTGDKRKVQEEMVKTLNFLNNTPDNIRKKLVMEQKVEALSLPKVMNTAKNNFLHFYVNAVLECTLRGWMSEQIWEDNNCKNGVSLSSTPQFNLARPFVPFYSTASSCFLLHF